MDSVQNCDGFINIPSSQNCQKLNSTQLRGQILNLLIHLEWLQLLHKQKRWCDEFEWWSICDHKITTKRFP
jgi:hypothetical protein